MKGKTAWKYWSPQSPPQPVKQASVVNPAPGEDHCAVEIIETPLSALRKRRHQAISLRNSAVKLTWWWLKWILRRRMRMRAIKIRLWRTRLEIKISFPTKDWRAVFVAVHFRIECTSNRSISGLTERVKVSVSNSIPKQEITLEGWHEFFKILVNRGKTNR